MIRTVQVSLLAIALFAAVALAIGLSGSDAAPLVMSPGPPLAKRYTGVNLAGGEFKSPSGTGVYGRDYIYPDAATAAPFVRSGMSAVRLPFRWERLQPEPMAPLDRAEVGRLDASIRALRGFQLIILDPHNYAAYKRAKLGTPAAPGALLADFWTRLADHYRNDRQIAFGLMNEPNGIGGELWRDLAQQSLTAIRATGARNLVLVPGSNWTGAHSWTSGADRSNAARLGSVRDPAGNMAFEMHEYPDLHSKGTEADCVSPEKITARLAPATQWLRTNKARGFLAEFGAPPTPECLATLDAMLRVMDDGRDVWLGWTYWAGGSRWGNYPLSVQPRRGGEPRPQMDVLVRHLAR